MKELQSHLDAFRSAANAFIDDKVPTMGAALAYYTAFSIAPLLVIALGVVGIVFGKGGGGSVFDAIRGLVGDNGAQAIQSMVESAANRPSTGALATALGFVTLIFGASGVFTQLQESLNTIWRVTIRPGAGWVAWLKRRLLSFGMVGVIAFLLMVSLFVSAGLAAAGSLAAGTFAAALPGGALLWKAVNFAVSFAVVSALFALIFKVLPDVRLPWRDALRGGAFTSALFTAGKAAIGAYLGRAGAASAYGAAGSVIVVLLWVYYSSQILLFGAEITRAYATRRGRVVAPKPDAQLVVDAPLASAAREPRLLGSPQGDAFVVRDGGAPWLVGSAALLAGGAWLVSRSLKKKAAHPSRDGILGGAAAGAGAGLLALLEGPQRFVPERRQRNAAADGTFGSRAA